MTKRLACAAVVAAALPLMLAGIGHAQTPKVLLIGIDGLRSDALLVAHTPNLDSLIDDGIVDYETSVISADVTSSDTVSGPGWTTFLTGTWADRHGVLDNSFEGRNPQAAPHCFRLVKQADPKIRTASFVSWIPIDQFVTTDADIQVGVFAPPKADAPESQDYNAADARVAAFAADTLAHDPVDLVFTYFGAVDETGHAYGFHPSVAQYIAEIETIDSHVGTLMTAVRDRVTAEDEDWLIIVSTDHGGEGTGHGGGRHNPIVHTAPMIVSGAAAAKGRGLRRDPATVDVVAVAVTHLGVGGDATSRLAGSAQGWLQRP